MAPAAIFNSWKPRFEVVAALRTSHGLFIPNLNHILNILVIAATSVISVWRQRPSWIKWSKFKVVSVLHSPPRIVDAKFESYIFNDIMAISVISGISVWHQPPSWIRKLKIWGSRCIAHVPRITFAKFEPCILNRFVAISATSVISKWRQPPSWII